MDVGIDTQIGRHLQLDVPGKLWDPGYGRNSRDQPLQMGVFEGRRVATGGILDFSIEQS